MNNIENGIVIIRFNNTEMNLKNLLLNNMICKKYYNHFIFNHQLTDNSQIIFI
jgi:hypothetical protein